MKHKPIQILIVDGQNNHQWQLLTPIIQNILEHTRRFKVTIATTPPADASASAWNRFRPDFRVFDIILSNYFGRDWPTETMDALESYVKRGGGYVAVHAGGSSFSDRESYNRMVGLAWREADFGNRITIDSSGKPVRTPRGKGHSSMHGPNFAFPICHHQPSHPILKGLPTIWMHDVDELWYGLRGPAKGLMVLASAFSPRTGAREPMMWTVKFGRGRVFVTVLGHLWVPEDTRAVLCVGFRDTLARGCQWAAQGKVNLPVPRNFPTEGNIMTGLVQYS